MAFICGITLCIRPKQYGAIYRGGFKKWDKALILFHWFDILFVPYCTLQKDVLTDFKTIDFMECNIYNEFVECKK